MPNSEYNAARDKSFETLKSALIGLLFILLGWLFNSFQNLEQRVFNISTTTMTQANGLQLEDRLNRSMETKFSEMNSRIDLVLRLLQQGSDKNSSR